MNIPPNIVMIVADTLRKDTILDNIDHLPNFKTLIDESRLYPNAISSAAWTVPSHASMLTGLYPTEHKMITRFSVDSFINSLLFFPPNAYPLQKSLQDKGYNTVSITANPMVGPNTAFESGFDQVILDGSIATLEDYRNAVKDVLGIKSHNPAEAIITQSSIGFIREIGVIKTIKILWLLAKSKIRLKKQGFPMVKGYDKILENFLRLDLKPPYYVFLNVMEMHEPYPKVPFSKWDNIRRDYIEYGLKGISNADNKHKRSISHIKDDLFKEAKLLDSFIGRVIFNLKKIKQYENTVLVFVSDHGQSLGEDNFIGHSYMLNDALVNVPMIIRKPGNTGSIERDYVSTSKLKDYILSIVDDLNAEYPKDDYIFSEEFGFDKSRWQFLWGDYSKDNKPSIKKRIWNKNGYSLTVDGTKGVLESFSKDGKKLEIESQRDIVSDLLEQLEIFCGNSEFKIPGLL